MSYTNLIHDLVDQLIDANIITFDKKYQCTFKSGAKSCLHIDFAKSISFPLLQKSLCSLYLHYLKRDFAPKYDYIVGVSENSIALVAQISAELSIPMLMLNQQNNIIGKFLKNKSVLVIQDTIYSGASCVNIVQKLRSYNLNPIEIVCLLKRSQLTLGEIFSNPYSQSLVPIYSLLNIRDIEFKIKIKQSRICVAADVTKMSELIHIIKNLGKYISIVKIHIDMIEDFVPYGKNNSIDVLQNLKQHYGILIWEDRKFADISSITSKQINHGIHQIGKWADIISIHYSAGPEIFYKNFCSGIKIVITGLTVLKTLSNKNYQQEIINIVDPLSKNLLNIDVNNHVNKNLIGIVTNQNIQTNLLKIVENVHHDVETDGYKMYHRVCDTKWADIVITDTLVQFIGTNELEKIVEQYSNQQQSTTTNNNNL